MSNDVIDLTEAKIARLRNLKPYKGLTDDEIRAKIDSKRPKTRTKAPKTSNPDRRFNEILKQLQDEFNLDMNSSNDVENLKALVRFQIQLEKVNTQIAELQAIENPSKEDTITLKNLGDFQRNVANSVADFQDKLGITRKQRKEKVLDDIPQWIDGVLDRAKSMFDRKTVKVECPKDQIELFRYWVNFPNEQHDIEGTFTCWKCGEQIMHTG